MSHPGIAIVGMACRYPEAADPAALWENVLAQRRAFRRLPPERLRLEDYYSRDRRVPDTTYGTQAAVIEGWEFDRVRFRVAGSTYRAADLVHWLALEVADQTLADAGFPGAVGLERDTASVILGNTLTGEFSRANTLRLRWPYVRRVVEAGLTTSGWGREDRHRFLESLERAYKEPFPEVNEESLAGGLSNTIAGRICNAFDLHGGGYTVDGACSASLLAVITACNQLVLGDADVALAGGVDLSLDPFELVGFAKTGALAPELMRVYDAHSAGFWPGEGCGMVALMREDDARAQGKRVYAVLRGWGVSSDGSGGITRPEAKGQALALARAYRRAGFGADTVAYFEGHGTGTEVGDATELRVLVDAHGEAGEPAALSSVKALIGHTKAAAGVAGLLKAVLAIHHQVLPPATGCETPHPILRQHPHALRVLARPQAWPEHLPLRAGVSAMGFGGINTHVVLEGAAAVRRSGLDARERRLAASPQDAELVVLAGATEEDFRRSLARLREHAPALALSELRDVAAAQAATLPEEQATVRGAVVASNAEELAQGLEQIEGWLAAPEPVRLDLERGVFLGRGRAAPRLVFVFPGQGSPAHLGGGLWRRRFEAVESLYAGSGLPEEGDGISTRIAQPAICLASLAGLHVLRSCGVEAEAGLGHSLGELTALCWGGAYDEAALLRIADARGRAMAELGSATGAMAGLRAPAEEVTPLLEGTGVVMAGFNGPRQTVISGERAEIETVVARAREKGISAAPLAVSHAFHSPLVAASEASLAAQLAREHLEPPSRPVFSTVTGERLDAGSDVADILRRQVTHPVRFREALLAASANADLVVEVGPGRVLAGLVAENLAVPVVSLDAGGPGLRGLLQAVGAAYALGAPVRVTSLFADRAVRAYDFDRPRRFLANPCERAPVHEEGAVAGSAAAGPTSPAPEAAPELPAAPLDLIRALVAARAELPLAAIEDEHRLLGDLRLNSIVVGQVASEAARRLGLPPLKAPTEFAGATVAEMARALDALAATKDGTAPAADEPFPAGVDAWARAFVVDDVACPRPSAVLPDPAPPGSWIVLAPAGHPLAGALRSAVPGWPAGGVVLCLPEEPDESAVPLLLEAAQNFLARREARLVVVHQGGGGAFARTAHLESGGRATTVVEVPFDHPRAVEWVAAEMRATQTFLEARYNASGGRTEPRMRLLEESPASGDSPLDPDDVLLVTGGGKGIAAECALALGEATGAHVAILGRSAPETDPVLAANLKRFAERGVRFGYFPADVTDAEATASAIKRIEQELGPVSAVLHGAGLNVPRRLEVLDEDAFAATLAPKLGGVRNLMAALDPARLKLFVAFGSIIARTGLPGEADYGTANEWMARLLEGQADRFPRCRRLCLEWSVWSAVGMGERLGRIEALAQQGVTAITPEDGVRLLLALLARPGLSGRVVVSGRFGRPGTVTFAAAELPFLRFLERPRVHVPDVELVTEFDLSTRSDPYLEDHVLGGERLFPAVLGLEAMAQGVRALAGDSAVVAFESVRFDRPLVVPKDGAITVRLAVLARGAGRYDAVLRTAATGFAVNHFEATCRVAEPRAGRPARGGPDAGAPIALDLVPGTTPPVELDPERELYGRLLFQGGRFRRIARYHHLEARACLAEIRAALPEAWFGTYLPAELLLGDPGARDAALHGIQACIPHATVLPLGVERIEFLDREGRVAGMRARERERNGTAFLYDLEMLTASGTVAERWTGLALRAVEPSRGFGAEVGPLLGPYFERRVEDLVPGVRIRIALERGEDGRDARRQRALARSLGPQVQVLRRPDGKPETSSPDRISVSHADAWTLLAVSDTAVGCDLERRDASETRDWPALIGDERWALVRTMAREARETEGVAALRVWTAMESLKKAGARLDTPLLFSRAEADGWVLLTAGEAMVATWSPPPGGVGEGIVVGFLATPVPAASVSS